MKAYVTVGIPGSGKSTWAQNHPELVEINLDKCRAMASGDAADQSSTAKAVEIHTNLLDNAIAESRDIVISDTNLNKVFRDKLIDKLNSSGYDVELVVFDVPFDVCMERNKNRDRVVPEYAMLIMQEKFEDFLKDYRRVTTS
jgi:predicted kinase